VKITLEVEVSDEDLRAGNWAFASHRPQERMDVEEMLQFHLKPALQSKLHALRSQMKWAEGKFWDHPNLRKEEGYTYSKVVDEKGQRHDVMLPSGKKYPSRVTEPREGSWECPTAPTKFCWYDHQQDPAWDSCLFCGHPHERK
jgi:hypothetical protein